MHVGTKVRFTEHRGSWKRCGCETGIIVHKDKFHRFDDRFTRDGCEYPEYKVHCGCPIEVWMMPYEIENETGKGD